MRRPLVVLVLMLSVVGCAAKAPPSLSPAGVVTWQANESAVILGTVQHASIELNKVQRCEPACAPLLSDRNTGVVVDAVTDGLLTLRAVPQGWKATTSAALERMAVRLDEAGRAKLSTYLQAGRAALAALP